MHFYWDTEIRFFIVAISEGNNRLKHAKRQGIECLEKISNAHEMQFC